MSDEELDDLFRKSAERYEPPFDEEAWEAMEQRLDSRRTIWARMKRFIPLLLLALLVSVGAWWQLANEPAAPSEKIRTAEEDTAGQDTRSWGQKSESKVAALPELSPEPVQPPSSNKGTVNVAPVKAVSSKTPEVIAKRGVPVKPLVSVATEVKQRVPSMATNVGDTAGAGARLKAHLPDSVSQVALQKAAQPEAPDSSSQKPKVKEQAFLKNITLSLVLAPDFTTVRFREPDQISLNAGLLVSVPLSSRFSLVTGVIGANKVYYTEAKEYEPYPGYWTGKSLPDEIEATCQVLDIPLNLQYLVWKHGKNKVYVQAGVSSYLMLHEKYTYTYEHAGQDTYSKSWEISNRNRHWFGMQNLSVGYTRRLSPAFVVGAEPFVKIPLSSIGEGQVKLTSAGIFFTAGYTLDR
ncbi:outer membrane beta-barrel protein [Pontibacter korlensis]|uniref:Uncharacterized protein n=1 Tax=Pontibacter korlensis TaxID=400092 RepID=A0A0E3ZHL6_9BACT|nr:outer membrane beta-barrel protein [Pontibacter korlensis]AKD04148.1 hypothetical protein PKOR_14950 [Pontibacter korlensis]